MSFAWIVDKIDKITAKCKVMFFLIMFVSMNLVPFLNFIWSSNPNHAIRNPLGYFYRNDKLPPTYFEKFCLTIHKDLLLDDVCINWFRQATDSCALKMLTSNDEATKIFKFLRNMFFSETKTSLQDTQLPIGLMPDQLTIEDCCAFFADIVDDYIDHAPHYIATARMNDLLWISMRMSYGIIFTALVMLWLIKLAIRIGNHRTMSRATKNKEEAQERQIALLYKKSVHVLEGELKKLGVPHLFQPQDFLADIGTPMLIMKMGSKLDFLNGIVARSWSGKTRLYRQSSTSDESEENIQTRNAHKIIKFLDEYSSELRVIMLFEDDPIFVNGLNANTAKHFTGKPTTAIKDSPRKSPRLCFYEHSNKKQNTKIPTLSPTKSVSPRSATFSEYTLSPRPATPRSISIIKSDKLSPSVSPRLLNRSASTSSSKSATLPKSTTARVNSRPYLSRSFTALTESSLAKNGSKNRTAASLKSISQVPRSHTRTFTRDTKK